MAWKRKYCFNENYFENIDEEHKAYWLGFIYADGCVDKRGNSLSIALCSGDESHLEKLAKDIEYNGEIKHKFAYSNYSNGLYESVRIELNSAKLAKDLRNKGVCSNKTFVCSFPTKDIVPEEFQQHFIRGFMDGDGSIARVFTESKYQPYDYSLKFIGTYEMLYGINRFFNRENEVAILQDTRCNIPIHTLGYHGNNIVFSFLSTLYREATIYLDRKYIRFCDLVNTLEYNYYEKLEKEYGRYSLVLGQLEEGKKPKTISKDTGICNTTVYSIIKPLEDIKKANIDKYLIENKGKVSKSELSKRTGRSRDYIRELYKKL